MVWRFGNLHVQVFGDVGVLRIWDLGFNLGRRALPSVKPLSPPAPPLRTAPYSWYSVLQE